MAGQVLPLIDRLCEAGNPRNLNDWESRDGYYVAASRISAADVPDLIDIVRKWNDPDWPSAGGPQVDPDKAELLPVTAWRTLADLKAEVAVAPLVDILCELDDEFDDWACEELPHVFGKIGQASIEPLTRVATNDDVQDFIRSIAVRGLRCVAHYHRYTRDRIVAGLTELMANAVDGHVDFYSTLLMELVELHAVEAAEPIERAFAANFLDVAMMGNWEAVRQKLEVEGLGLKMPDNPHNSIAQLQRRTGIGIFSDRPIFGIGKIDHDAEQAYYERAYNTFSKSSEAQQVVERHGNLGWFQTLLEFGLNYLGETVDEMTPGSVKEFVLDYVPRKISTEADAAAEIICELALFWQYLGRVYNLPAAKAVVDWLRTDGLVARLEADLSDPSNFGMAKSLFVLGKDAGFDMTTEAGVAEFVMAYNQSLLADNAPASPDLQNYRVSRNAPCPCGSGKKYKKCCGNPRQRG